MKHFMNQKDMHEMLEKVRPDHESYRTKVWCIISDDSDMGKFALESLSIFDNLCCYCGVTEHYLVMVIMSHMNISNIQEKIVIPIKNIRNYENQRGILPGQRLVRICFDNTELHLSLQVRNPFTSHIPNQKQNVAELCHALAI